DPDLPANALTFSLIAPPSGAAINPSTGLFTWRPTETQGPGSYTVRVRVTDNGAPSLSDTRSFIVAVNESNSAPVLAPIADQTINEGGTLTLTATATDPDVPANNLTFALRRAPAGATINTINGLFTWTPSPDQVPSTNLITIRVTDDGVPNLS